MKNIKHRILTILYWSVAAYAIIQSLEAARTVLKTNITTLLGFTIIAFLGFYSQEKLNNWLESHFSRVYNILNIKDVEQPKWIKRFQKLTIGIAITCFWASIGGIDLTTHFISNSFMEIRLKEDIRLMDLTVFVLYIGVIPQFIWGFNYGFKKSFKKD